MTTIVILLLLLLFNHVNPFTSPMDRIYPNTLDELLLESKDTDDAIYGNPLLYKKCSDALLDSHEYNIDYLLKNSGIPTPWFWSRETLDATIKHLSLHRRLKVTSGHLPDVIIPWSTHAAYEYGRNHDYLPHHMVRWYHRLGETVDNHHKNLSFHSEHLQNQHKLALMNDKENYISNLPNDVHYYHIEKSGSSSMGGTLSKFGGFNRTYLSENVITHNDCGFTFVREPISRFISGYYTVNRLIYHHNKYAKKRYPIPDLFTFWNKTGEPQRILEFINNLLQFRYEFLVSSPLEHIMSQTSILSVAQLDIHFVGRLSKFKDHLDRVMDHCADKYMQERPDEIMKRMAGFGTNGLDQEPQYTKMMGLQTWNEGDVLPAYIAIADNYDAYQSLVEYFKQDMICFGYHHDYNSFRAKVYKKLQQQKQKYKEDNIPIIQKYQKKQGQKKHSNH